MQNFELTSNKTKKAEMSELKMSVSAICNKDDKKVAYVTFSAEEFYAEGIIPECKITKSKGFSSQEIEQLEEYMLSNLSLLKNMASKVNLLDAFMGV